MSLCMLHLHPARHRLNVLRSRLLFCFSSRSSLLLQHSYTRILLDKFYLLITVRIFDNDMYVQLLKSETERFAHD